MTHSAKMFLRPHQRSKEGKDHTYGSLVETVRTGSGPRQRTLCYCGELNGSAQARWLKSIEVFNAQGEAQQLQLFPSHIEVPDDDPQVARVVVNRVRRERTRQFGACFLGWEWWKQLGLDGFFPAGGGRRCGGGAMVARGRGAGHQPAGRTRQRVGDRATLVSVEQIGAQQHLVEQVPVIAKVLGTLEVKSAAGLAMVTEMVPHGIVEELVFLALYQAGLALGDAAAHDGVQAAGDDHARLEGVHIEIAEQNGALMTNGGLDLVDALRQVHGLNHPALLRKVHLGGEMGGGDQDALPPR